MSASDELNELANAWAVACRSRPVDVAGRDAALARGKQIFSDRGFRDYSWFEHALGLFAPTEMDMWGMWPATAFAIHVLDGNIPRRLLRAFVAAAVCHPDVQVRERLIDVVERQYGRAAVQNAIRLL